MVSAVCPPEMTIAPAMRNGRTGCQTRNAPALASPPRLLLPQLEAAVASWHYSAAVLQSRRWHRVALRNAIAITPLDDQTEACVGESRLAEGRDVSLGGLSFEHRHLLPYRRIAVTLLLDNADPVSLLVHLTWCRFIQCGVYHSGGKFLRPLAPMFAADADWTALPRA